MRRTLIAFALSVALGGCSEPSVEVPPCEGEGVVCHVAGIAGEAGYNGEGKPPEETQLNLPSAARIGPDGLLYVMDFNNMRLRCRIDAGVVDTIAGNGVHAFAYYNVDALESPLENPIDFAFLPDGRIVLASLHDPRLFTIEHDGTMQLFAGTGDVGDGGDGLSADVATFSEISAIVIAPDGSVFVSDDQAHRVRVIRPDGIVYPYAGIGEQGDAGDGGPAVDAKLYHPEGLALDADGNLFVADTFNHRIRRIDAETGIITTVAGTGGDGGFSGDDGPAEEADLRLPRGVDVAPDGRLYIADTFNHRIRRIEDDGTIVTVAGTDKGYSGDGGPALEAQFKGPALIDVTEDAIYIPDQQNQVVRIVHLGSD
jgi:hypothetical protein